MRLIILELKKFLCILLENNELKLAKFIRNLDSNADDTIEPVNKESKGKPNKLKKIV